MNEFSTATARMSPLTVPKIGGVVNHYVVVALHASVAEISCVARVLFAKREMTQMWRGVRDVKFSARLRGSEDAWTNEGGRSYSICPSTLDTES